MCASGKSTLIRLLTDRGYRCRHIAQEHSYVQNMWKRLTNPDILIFLEVSYTKTLTRKKLNWTIDEYNLQLQRLGNAYENADIRILTENITPGQLIDLVENEIFSLIKSRNQKTA